MRRATLIYILVLTLGAAVFGFLAWRESMRATDTEALLMRDYGSFVADNVIRSSSQRYLERIGIYRHEGNAPRSSPLALLRERMPALPEEAYFSVAPDWICEVLSPSTASLDRVKKMTVYARERVSHAWLVDPIGQTLEVLRLDNGRWTILSTWAKADVVRAEPFDALELDLTLLWETV